MSQVLVEDRDGDQHRIEIQPGISLMETIREAGIDDILALCGGQCCCSTCHVYVDPTFLGQLPDMGDDECDLLECSGNRKDNSRLSCQIQLSHRLDGLSVRIAPEE